MSEYEPTVFDELKEQDDFNLQETNKIFQYINDKKDFGWENEAKNQGDFMSGMSASYEQLKATGKLALSIGTDIVGAEDTTKSLRKSALKNIQVAESVDEASGTQSFTEIEDPSDFLDWMQGTAGSLAPDLAESLVMAGVGAVLGNAPGAVTGLFAKGAVKKVLTKQFKGLALDQVEKEILGAAVKKHVKGRIQNFTMTAGNVGMGIGEVGKGIMDEDLNIDKSTAITMGTIHGFAETVGEKFTMPGLYGKTGKSVFATKASESLTKRLGKGVGNSFIAGGIPEGLTEIAQTITENTAQLMENDDYSIEDMMKVGQYVESFAGGLFGGFLLSGGGRGISGLKGGDKEGDIENTSVDDLGNGQDNAETVSTTSDKVADLEKEFDATEADMGPELIKEVGEETAFKIMEGMRDDFNKNKYQTAEQLTAIEADLSQLSETTNPLNVPVGAITDTEIGDWMQSQNPDVNRSSIDIIAKDYAFQKSKALASTIPKNSPLKTNPQLAEDIITDPEVYRTFEKMPTMIKNGSRQQKEAYLKSTTKAEGDTLTGMTDFMESLDKYDKGISEALSEEVRQVQAPPMEIGPKELDQRVPTKAVASQALETGKDFDAKEVVEKPIKLSRKQKKDLKTEKPLKLSRSQSKALNTVTKPVKKSKFSEGIKTIQEAKIIPTIKQKKSVELITKKTPKKTEVLREVRTSVAAKKAVSKKVKAIKKTVKKAEPTSLPKDKLDVRKVNMELRENQQMKKVADVVKKYAKVTKDSKGNYTLTAKGGAKIAIKMGNNGAKWDAKNKTIHLPLDDADIKFTHELTHAMKDLGLITDGEFKSLARKAKRFIDSDKYSTYKDTEAIRTRYESKLGKMSDADLDHEIVAHMMEDWRKNGVPADDRSLFEKVMDFFYELYSSVKGVDKKAEVIAREVFEGKPLAKETKSEGGEVRYSLDPHTQNQADLNTPPSDKSKDFSEDQNSFLDDSTERDHKIHRESREKQENQPKKSLKNKAAKKKADILDATKPEGRGSRLGAKLDLFATETIGILNKVQIIDTFRGYAPALMDEYKRLSEAVGGAKNSLVNSLSNKVKHLNAVSKHKDFKDLTNVIDNSSINNVNLSIDRKVFAEERARLEGVISDQEAQVSMDKKVLNHDIKNFKNKKGPKAPNKKAMDDSRRDLKEAEAELSSLKVSLEKLTTQEQAYNRHIGDFNKLAPELKKAYKATYEIGNDSMIALKKSSEGLMAYYEKRRDTILNNPKSTPEDIRDLEAGYGALREHIMNTVGNMTHSEVDFYVPSSRFGDFVVTGTILESGQSFMETFESLAEAKERSKFINESVPELSASDVKTRKKDQGFADILPNIGFVGDTRKMLKKQVDNGLMTQKEADQVLEVLTNSYIVGLNNNSPHKHFMHKKGIAGKSPDLIRTMNNYITSSAGLVSDFEYTPQIQDVLNQIEAQADSTTGDDNIILNRVVKHLKDREDISKKIPVANWAKIATSIGYAFKIAGSPASALVNLSQLGLHHAVLVGRLSQKGGAIKAYKNASKIMTKSSLSAAEILVNTVRNAGKTIDQDQAVKDIDGLVEGGMTRKEAFKSWATSAIPENLMDQVPDQYKAAVKYAIDHGSLSLSSMIDVMDFGRSSNLGNESGTQKTKDALLGGLDWYSKVGGSMFHATEVMNRLTSVIASYEAEIANGLDPNSVVDSDGILTEAGVKVMGQVVTDVDMSMFNYGSDNRARALQGNFARVAGQFKQYALSLMYLYGSTFKKALNAQKGLTEAQVREARMTFASLNTFATMSAGLTGTFGFTALEMMLSLISGDDDDPIEVEQEVRQWLQKTIGKTGERAFMDGGFNAMGIDLSSRIGHDLIGNFFFLPGGIDAKRPEDKFNAYLKAVAGPSIGILGDIHSGVHLLGDGQPVRAMQKFIPGAVSNFSKGLMTAGDDKIRSFQGDVISEDNVVLKSIAKMIGFSSADVRDYYTNANFESAKGITQSNRRRDLRNQWAKLKEGGKNSEASKLLSTEIRAYNKTNKDKAQITAGSLRGHLKRRNPPKK